MYLATPHGENGGGPGRLDRGPLKETEVLKLRGFYGLNTVGSEIRKRWYHLFLGALLHPFNILLMLLSTTSGLAKEFETMGIMLVMVVLSTALRFHQEWKSKMEVEHLLQFVETKVTVIRKDMVEFDDREYVVPSTELVPGDWVQLSPGEVIPADVELVKAKDFHVSQAALTGEAIPVLKFCRGRQASWVSPTEMVLQGKISLKEEAKAVPLPKNVLRRVGRQSRSFFGLKPNFDGEDIKDTEKGRRASGVNFSDMDRPDVCFMGSAVISGKATGRVVNTGRRTVFGKIAKEMVRDRPQNTFQLGVRRISWLFFVLMTCMVPPVLLLQGFLDKDWFQAFMFSLSVAVGLTPEMLPMIVNTTLAKGAMEMSRKRCIVKQLDAIINMGGIDVLCTDKTGTLTKSVVTLYKYVNGKGVASPLPLLLGYLNAHFQSCHENPLDTAITEHYSSQDKTEENAKSLEDLRFLEEIPFDFERRRVSVVIREGIPKDARDGDGTTLLICKGAVEETLGVCTSCLSESFEGSLDFSTVCHKLRDASVETLTKEKLAKLEAVYEQLSEDGLRVIAVAYKKIANRRSNFEVSHESALTFAGFLAFLDPPKESTREAIKNLLEHNVNVKVLTGDSSLVCKKICSEIGLKVDHVITGQEVLRLTEASKGSSMQVLRNIVEENSIFTKLTPLQKSDIVKALQANGHVVAFLGDGINDASALSEADVGISVDTGMDICKEAADMILLEKDLTVIGSAVVVGRRTFGNTLKYIVMGTSAAFGNVFSILIASSWLSFEPMASLHILVQNLLYDISQMAIPWDEMDPEYLLEPHQWSMRTIVNFMLFMGPWSSMFDIATFLFLYFYMGIQTNDDLGAVRMFQSSWFSVGILTQTLVVHMIRTKKIPFVESRASIQLIAMTVVIMCVGLSLPYIPGLNKWLSLVPLPWQMYPFLGAVLVCYCVVVQFSKYVYLKIFNQWY